MPTAKFKSMGSSRKLSGKGENEIVVNTSSMAAKQANSVGNRAYSSGYVEPITPDSRFDTMGDRYAMMRSPTSDREGPPASSTPSSGIIGRKSPSLLRMMSKRNQSPTLTARSNALTTSKHTGRKSPAVSSAHASYAASATAAARASASSAPNAAPASTARASGPPVTAKPARRTQRVITPQMVARRKININNFPLVMKSEEESKILNSNASVAVSVNTEATEKVCNRATSVKSRRRMERFEPELEQVNTFESLHTAKSNDKKNVSAVAATEKASATEPDLEKVNTFESFYTVESNIAKVAEASIASTLEKVNTFESLHTVESDNTKLTAVTNAKTIEREEPKNNFAKRTATTRLPAKNAAAGNEKFSKIVAANRSNIVHSSDNVAIRSEVNTLQVNLSPSNSTTNNNKADDWYSGFFLGEVRPESSDKATVTPLKSPEKEVKELGGLPPRPVGRQNKSNSPISVVLSPQPASCQEIAPTRKMEKKSVQPLILQISSSSEVVAPESSLSPRNKEEIEIQLTREESKADEIKSSEVTAPFKEEKKISILSYALNTPEDEEKQNVTSDALTPDASSTPVPAPVPPLTTSLSSAVTSKSLDPADKATAGSEAMNSVGPKDHEGPVVTDVPEQKDKETVLMAKCGGSEPVDTDSTEIQEEKKPTKATDLNVLKSEKSSSILKYFRKSGSDDEKKNFSSSMASTTPGLPAPPARGMAEAEHQIEKHPSNGAAAYESAKAEPATMLGQDQSSQNTTTDASKMSSSILKFLRKSGSEATNAKASSDAPEASIVSENQQQMKVVENISSERSATQDALKTTLSTEENGKNVTCFDRSGRSSSSSASSDEKNCRNDDRIKDSVSSTEKEQSIKIDGQHEEGSANAQPSDVSALCEFAVSDLSPDPKFGSDSTRYKQCDVDGASPVVGDITNPTKNSGDEKSVSQSKQRHKPAQMSSSLRANESKPDSITRLDNETCMSGSHRVSASSRSDSSAKDDSEDRNDECQAKTEIDFNQVISPREAFKADKTKNAKINKKMAPNRKKKRGIFSTFLGKKSKVIDEEREYENDEIYEPKVDSRVESKAMKTNKSKVDPHVQMHAETKAEQGDEPEINKEIESEVNQRAAPRKNDNKAMNKRSVTIAGAGGEHREEKPRRSLQQTEVENDELDIHLQATLSDAEFFSVESSITTDKEAFAPVSPKTGLIKRTSSLIRNPGLPLRRTKSLNKSEYDEHLKCVRNGKSAAKADNKRKEEFDDNVADVEEEGGLEHHTEVEQVPSKDAEIQCTMSDDLQDEKRDMTMQTDAEKGVSFVGSEDSSDDIQALFTMETFDDTFTKGARFLKPRSVAQLDIGTGTLHDAAVGPGFDLNDFPASPSQQVRFRGVEGGTQTNLDHNALNDQMYPMVRTVSSGLAQQAPHRASSIDHSTQTSVEQEENVGSFSKIMESMALFSAKLCIGTGAAMVTCANSCSDRPHNSAQIIASSSFVESEAVRQFSPRNNARMQESSIFRATQQDKENETTDIFSRALAMALRQVSNNDDHRSVPSRQNSAVKESLSAVQSNAGSFDKSECDFVSVDGRLVKAGKRGRRRKKRVPRNIAVKPKKEEEKEQPASKQKPGGFLWGKKNKAITKTELTPQVANNDVGDPAEITRVDSSGKAKAGITQKLAKGVKNIAKARLAVMYEV